MKAPTKIGKPGVNYYSLLGVPSTATQEEITRAFRKKILHVHLDKMGPDEDTELCYLTIEAHRILSDKAMRQKYDVERSSSTSYKDSEEKFIPAGYICYNVGDQPSRQLLDSIHGWAKEYDRCAEDLSDNYFNCFSQMMEKIIKDNDHEETSGINKRKQTCEYFYCDTCDKNFLTETHHWDSVINPYRGMFYSDQLGVPALKAYFGTLIESNLYNWEMRYLPNKLLGIWGSSEWSTFRSIRNEAIRILKECQYQFDDCRSSSSASSTSSSSESSSPEPGSSNSEVISKLETLMDKSSSNNKNESFISAQNSFLRRSLIQNLIWVLENKGDTMEQIISRMNELLMQDDLQEILCLGIAAKEILVLGNGEWEQLIQDALSHENFELAMMWAMLAIQSGDKGKGDWFQLGMTIRGMGDAVLAHFCFLLAGCDSPAAWNELADIFTQNGLHQAACEYHLNKGDLFHLLHKSKALKKIDPNASSIYTNIYYSTRVKGILEVLKNRSRQSSSESTNEYDAEIEELIEIIQDLGGNLLEGFRIIVSTWPDVFEESPGHWIHRATIQFLRKGKVNLKSQKLILAACHFLPDEEKQDEITVVAEDESKLTKEFLETALDTNDFEMLTDVLVHLNKRTLETAEEYLKNMGHYICPPSPEVIEESDGAGAAGTDDNEDSQDKYHSACSNPPIPSHKIAMIYLLSGSIFKIKELWLEAMKDFQTALLSAPEVMHRVLPCVSKLVQDIQFHEAVVTQVHEEIQDLQRHLLSGEYPNIDEFSSDKRRSLILTDVTPKMDYGYKDAVSRIQSDPNNLPPPPPPDDDQEAPPPPPANTPMVTLDKNSEAIQSGQQDGQIDHLSAAMAYVDLLKALPLQMHPGPIVMAASHFLRAMDDDVAETGKLYAYRNAIMLMAENLLRIDKKLQHTIHHGLTHKHMLSILLSAHEKLSKVLQLAKKNEKNDEENSKDAKTKKDLIRQSDCHLISKFMQDVVKLPKVMPLANIPTLNCSDLVYVETLGTKFLSQFCADKVRQKHQSPLIPRHLHAYTHFVEVWKGRSTLSDFAQVRVKAMEELLASRGWKMDDVQKKMSCPFLLLQDGYSPPVQCLLQLRDVPNSYRTIDGFHIDYVRGTIQLLFSRDTITPADTLFDHHDIRDIVTLSKAGLDRVIFSLENPDGGMVTSHPFKEVKVSIQGQGKSCNQQHQQKIWNQIPDYIQATLSRVSMLLCYLASGIEMCSESPFWMRQTDEGLLSRLDEHLQHMARSIPRRKAERRDEKTPLEAEILGKFWLNMVEVFEEIEEEEEENFGDTLNSVVLMHSRKLTYRVGQIRTEVRPNTLVMTIDPKRKHKRLNPEAEFCRDLTRNFQEFSRYYPEFARLEELVKISVVCSKLRQVLKENKAMMQELNWKGNLEDSGSSNDDKMKGVFKVCSAIEKFLGLKSREEQPSNSCNWFPATFCNNMDTDIYDVSAGIELDPVVTYGPVPTPHNSIKVPLENIFTTEEDLYGANQFKNPEMEDNDVKLEDDQSSYENTDEEEDEIGDGPTCSKDHMPSSTEASQALSLVPEESEDDSEDEDDEVNEKDATKNGVQAAESSTKYAEPEEEEEEENVKDLDDTSESEDEYEELEEDDEEEENSEFEEQKNLEENEKGGLQDDDDNSMDEESKKEVGNEVSNDEGSELLEEDEEDEISFEGLDEDDCDDAKLSHTDNAELKDEEVNTSSIKQPQKDEEDVDSVSEVCTESDNNEEEESEVDSEESEYIEQAEPQPPLPIEAKKVLRETSLQKQPIIIKKSNQTVMKICRESDNEKESIKGSNLESKTLFSI